MAFSSRKMNGFDSYVVRRIESGREASWKWSREAILRVACILREKWRDIVGDTMGIAVALKLLACPPLPLCVLKTAIGWSSEPYWRSSDRQFILTANELIFETALMMEKERIRVMPFSSQSIEFSQFLLEFSCSDILLSIERLFQEELQAGQTPAISECAVNHSRAFTSMSSSWEPLSSRFVGAPLPRSVSTLSPGHFSPYFPIMWKKIVGTPFAFPLSLSKHLNGLLTTIAWNFLSLSAFLTIESPVQPIANEVVLLESRAMQCAVKVLTPNNPKLNEHFSSEGTKSVVFFCQEGPPPTSGAESSGMHPRARSLGRATRAGLQLPISVCEELFNAFVLSQQKTHLLRISDGALVYITAVLEYLAAMVFSKIGELRYPQRSQSKFGFTTINRVSHTSTASSQAIEIDSAEDAGIEESQWAKWYQESILHNGTLGSFLMFHAPMCALTLSAHFPSLPHTLPLVPLPVGAKFGGKVPCQIQNEACLDITEVTALVASNYHADKPSRFVANATNELSQYYRAEDENDQDARVIAESIRVNQREDEAFEEDQDEEYAAIESVPSATTTGRIASGVLPFETGSSTGVAVEVTGAVAPGTESDMEQEKLRRNYRKKIVAETAWQTFRREDEREEHVAAMQQFMVQFGQ